MFFKKKVNAPTVIDRVEHSIFQVVECPFNGEWMPFTLRKLTHAEVLASGRFSLIETMQDNISKKKEKKFTIEEMSEYAESMHNIVSYALVAPTYDEIMERLMPHIKIDEINERMKQIKELFFKMNPSKEKKKLSEEYALLEMRSKLFLPVDFTSFVVSYSLDVDKTDIKKITEEMLFEAAIKAVKGHDNPADHIHGKFTDFNREDINSRAWMIYYDRVKDKRGK